MRKPIDYDGALKALRDKTRALERRKVVQLGELVVACGADKLDVEQLAGALLAAVDADVQAKEGWRICGAAFFQKRCVGRRRRDIGLSCDVRASINGRGS